LEKKIDSLKCLFLKYQQHPQVGQSSRHTQTVGASPTGDYNAGTQAVDGDVDGDPNADPWYYGDED
jgi:hypothetical protein